MMKIASLKSGKYVVAVSGGVDSMVLLDLLAKQTGIELIIAHFNHGIRPDSVEDEKLVKTAAEKYRLPFEAAQGQLRPLASEAEARSARYAFLKNVKKRNQATAIVTAHHQDDLIETAMINILRGTGPRGLSSLSSTAEILRPLLAFRKTQILAYAKSHSLAWHEDSTNYEDQYLRNYLRHNILPKLSANQRRQITSNIEKVAKNLEHQDKEIATLSRKLTGKINRSGFSLLPGPVANELIAFRLRNLGFRDFNNTLINKTNVLIRTGAPNSRHNLSKNVDLLLSKKEAELKTRPRAN